MTIGNKRKNSSDEIDPKKPKLENGCESTRKQSLKKKSALQEIREVNLFD